MKVHPPMHRRLVYMLAKAPRPGKVKTRLCPPLTPVQAAQLAQAFAEDTLAMLTGVSGVETRLALDRGPAPAASDRLSVVAERLGIAVEDQGDGDLGRRMQRLLERGLQSGCPTILVGSDAPDLPPQTIEVAFEALSRVDAVLVPASDGGYVLVGARRPIPGLFKIEAAWSSQSVFTATCDALVREAVSFEVLASWEDVDDAAALGRLVERLGATQCGQAAVTQDLIERWRREGVRF